MENCIHHWVFFQWFLPNDMALFALTMSQKPPWDKFLGERLRALADTLGGAAILVSGVTTFGSCDEPQDSLTWAGILFTCVCNIV
jgi:hypothetical protein